ncbi:MAG TPA: MerR family transcriptional regulator, partial [Holophagaceae bacterium]|nr:MerR family transcriptional regulator [Holophagaceae bacterium]
MSEAARSISALARAFGLSRSALLHYDRVGLLRPARRSAKGYRVYSEADARRLEDICTLRRAGL